MANPMDYFNPASVRGLYSKIQERERQKMLNDILARNVEQGPDTPFVDEQAQFMGQQSPAGLVSKYGGRRLNMQNALSDMTKEGLGLDALKLEKGSMSGSGTPMNVQEYLFWESLPADKQERYLRLRRSTPFLDTGSQYITPSMVNPTQTTVVADKQLRPNERPSYIQTKEQAEKTGAATGQAQADLPGKEMDFERNMSLIDQIKNHPGKSMAIGKAGWIPGIPGTEQNNFIVALNQLKNTVFLENRQLLKGGGAITDFEGKKAEAAAARLERTQTPEAFDKALEEYQYWVGRGMEKLRNQAGNRGMQPTMQPTPRQNAGPTVGTIKGGYVFLGGDPSNPASWKPAK